MPLFTMVLTHSAVISVSNSYAMAPEAPQLHDAVPDLQARLQVNIRTFYPARPHADGEIPYVPGNLLAVKGGPRRGGPLLM